MGDVTDIKGKLNDLIRIEEKINNFSNTIESHSSRLDTHSDRIKEVELWKANTMGQNLENQVLKMEKQLNERHENLKEEITKSISEMKADFDIVQDTVIKNSGEKKVSNSIIKWAGGIIGAIFIALVTLRLKGG